MTEKIKKKMDIVENIIYKTNKILLTLFNNKNKYENFKKDNTNIKE